MTARKILIIENQWIEFQKICETLLDNNGKYDVLLDKNDVYWSTIEDSEKEIKFISLVTKIRIWVDDGHSEKYRGKAFETIRTLAEEADIVIMDHILGGSCSCLTGIDLAEELVEKIGIENMPCVLFLSKTESNEKNLLDRYEGNYIIDGKEKCGYKNFIKEKYLLQENGLIDEQLKDKVNAHTKWIHKGYFGDEILQTEYIKKYVIEDGIERLLNKSDKNASKQNKPLKYHKPDGGKNGS